MSDAPQRIWKWRSRIKGGAWDAWENGRFGGPPPPFSDVEEVSYILATPEALAASPEGQALIAAAVADALAPIRAAVTRYHLALDRREHGGVAGSRLQDEVQDILDMHWRQGVAAAAIGGDNG